ncbi:MAG: hypothetical protein O9310_06320, partial [Leptospiraceae bacterium]|nr:hypothetical protein [Leptospiraceae bacterium]
PLGFLPKSESCDFLVASCGKNNPSFDGVIEATLVGKSRCGGKHFATVLFAEDSSLVLAKSIKYFHQVAGIISDFLLH